MLKRFIKRSIHKSFRKFGVDLVRADLAPEFAIWDDIGRNYRDEEAAMPRIDLQPLPKLPFAPEPAKFEIRSAKGYFEETIYYSHLTLLKMLKDFKFSTVLDIGSHERRCTRVFEHCGKRVITVETAPGYEADYKQNYMDVLLPEKVDAIWCSQILEHQRNVGLFLGKVFDDLANDGVLAITVPYQVSSHLDFGHCNMFSPLMLIYQLVCAGFDCSKIALKCYNGNIAVILRKRWNGVNGKIPNGTLPDTPNLSELVDLGGKTITVRELLGDEIFPGMARSFPVEVHSNVLTWHNQSINWGDPI